VSQTSHSCPKRVYTIHIGLGILYICHSSRYPHPHNGRWAGAGKISTDWCNLCKFVLFKSAKSN